MIVHVFTEAYDDREHRHQFEPLLVAYGLTNP